MERINGHVGTRRPEIPESFANSLIGQGFLARAYKYFFKSRNERAIVECLKNVIKAGYESEQDLFIVRACLDMMTRSNNVEKVLYIRNSF